MYRTIFIVSIMWMQFTNVTPGHTHPLSVPMNVTDFTAVPNPLVSRTGSRQEEDTSRRQQHRRPAAQRQRRQQQNWRNGAQRRDLQRRRIVRPSSQSRQPASKFKLWSRSSRHGPARQMRRRTAPAANFGARRKHTKLRGRGIRRGKRNATSHSGAPLTAHRWHRGRPAVGHKAVSPIKGSAQEEVIAKARRLERYRRLLREAEKRGQRGRAKKLRSIIGAYEGRSSRAVPANHRSRAGSAAGTVPDEKKVTGTSDTADRPEAKATEASTSRASTEPRKVVKEKIPAAVKSKANSDVSNRPKTTARQSTSARQSYQESLTAARNEVLDIQKDLDRATSKHAKDVERARQTYLSAGKRIGTLSQKYLDAFKASDTEKATMIYADLQKAKEKSDRAYEKYNELKAQDIDPDIARNLQQKLVRAQERVTELQREAPPPSIPVTSPIGTGLAPQANLAPRAPTRAGTKPETSTTNTFPNTTVSPEQGISWLNTQSMGQDYLTSPQSTTPTRTTGASQNQLIKGISGTLIAAGDPLLKISPYWWAGDASTMISGVQDYQEGGSWGVVDNTIAPEATAIGGRYLMGTIVAGGTSLGPQMLAGGVGYGSYLVGQKYVAPIFAPYIGESLFYLDQKYHDGRLFTPK